MHRFLLPLTVSVLLSACASGPIQTQSRDRGGLPPGVTVAPVDPVGVSPIARSATYTCEDLTKVVLTEGQPNATVNFNSGLSLSLARQAGIGGLRFGQAPYEFHAAGSEGTMFNQGRPVRCRVL